MSEGFVVKVLGQEVFKVDTSVISGIFQTIVTEVVNALRPLIDSVIVVVRFFVDQVTNLIEQGFDFIDKELDALTPITPDNSKKAVAGIVARGFVLVVGVYIIALAMDAIPFIQGSTVLLLADFLKRLFGVDAFIGAFTGALVGTAMSTPLQLYANNKFRPNEFSLGQGIELFFKGEITETRFLEIAHRNGWSDDKIEAIKELFTHELGFSEMLRLGKLIKLDKSFILKNLQSNFIVGDSAVKIADAIFEANVSDELQSFIQTVQSDFALGYVNDDLYNQHLQFALKDPKEIEVIKKTGNLKLEITLTKYKINLLRKAFKRGQLTQGQLRTYLRNLRLREELVNAIWLEELLDAGIQANELLLFPQMSGFLTDGLAIETTFLIV